MRESAISIPAPNDKSGAMWEWLIKGCAVAGGLYHVEGYVRMVSKAINGDVTRWGVMSYNLIAGIVVLVAFYRLFKLKRWAGVLFCIGVWAAGTSLLIEGFEGVTAEDPWIVLAFTIGSLIIVSGHKQLKGGF